MKIQFIDRSTNALITENPPAEGLLKLIYDNPFGRTAIMPLVKRKFISDWYGRKMDKPTSVSKIAGFVNDLNIDMSESVKSIDEFKSFNDFFYRHLKPDSRPIGEGFVSPGDGKLIAFEAIDQVNDFFVKGHRFTIKDFLKNDALAKQYDGGGLLLLRLAPNDYHRFHFPFAGQPTPMRMINGGLLSVSPYALAKNFTRVFTENKRALVGLQTREQGQVLLAPVGATMVGAIHSTYHPNHPVEKGDEMGYFAFGGSSILILLEKGQFVIDQDILDNTKNKIETFVKMGERIGIPS